MFVHRLEMQQICCILELYESCSTQVTRVRADREIKLNFVNWYLQRIRYEEIVPTVILFGDEICVKSWWLV
jgi:hypothetical protein